MDLLTPVVAITDNHLLKLAGDVISSSTVNIPVGVDTIARGGSSCGFAVLLVIIFIVVEPARWSFMAGLADLADRLGVRSPLLEGSGVVVGFLTWWIATTATAATVTRP